MRGDYNKYQFMRSENGLFYKYARPKGYMQKIFRQRPLATDYLTQPDQCENDS